MTECSNFALVFFLCKLNCIRNSIVLLVDAAMKTPEQAKYLEGEKQNKIFIRKSNYFSFLFYSATFLSIE